MTGNTLAVDLGTISSCAYVTIDDEVVKFVEICPSAVLFAKIQEKWIQYYGNDGTNMRLQCNDNIYIEEYKMLLGKKIDDNEVQENIYKFEIKESEEKYPKIKISETKEYYPEELTAMTLCYLKEISEKHCIIDSLILTTHEFNFDDISTQNYMQSLIESAAIAGMQVKYIISEPLAILSAYLYTKSILNDNCKSLNKLLFVIDIGASCCKTYIIIINAGKVEIRNYRFDSINVNTYLLNYLAQQIKNEGSLDNIEVSELSIACENIKINLSELKTVDYVNLNEGLRFDNLFVTRQHFEFLIDHEIKKITAEIKQVFRKESLNICEVDDVIVVGGSCKMQSIRNMIESLFIRSIFDGVDPKNIIAYGAAAITKYKFLLTDTSFVYKP